MFGTPPLSVDEEKEVDGYFSIIKTSLSKSKRQSENAKRHKDKTVTVNNVYTDNRITETITIEKIRSDFPEIRGGLNANNIILDGVNLNELYGFIKDNADVRSLSMCSIVERFRQLKSI